VEIQRLAPGFDFDVTASEEGVQLIANNDGDATTEPSQPADGGLLLPMCGGKRSSCNVGVSIRRRLKPSGYKQRPLKGG
jgi:hypothetical protein